MRWIRNSVVGVLLIYLVNGCFTAPTYPVVPQIEFNNLCFIKSTDPQQLDQLVLSLKFKDGDGDIGLRDSDTTGQYVLRYRYVFQNKIINYKTKRLNPKLTVNGKPLPDFVSPFDCINWDVTKSPKDTIYVEYNSNYYNIFVDFYVDDGSNNFVKFDFPSYFKYPLCFNQGYNGRVPVLSADLGKKSPLEGKITYSMQSFGLDLILSIKKFKLKVTIQDRALNRSNELETPVYTLQSIGQGC